ncbi:MAG: aldose 1-epimerase family protein [Bacteroidota bacterium]
MIILQNEYIAAKLSAKGAELQGIRNKKIERDYLWNGNPAYWGKFSPVLFPIVGGLKDNTYYFDNQEFKLPRHGFARDREFTIEQNTATEATLSLSHDEETLKVYPFEFKLTLHYKLEDFKLTCTYRVSNPSDRKILFSIGAHPAFAAPSGDNLEYEDYFLIFNKDTELICHKIAQDLISDQTETIKLENHTLPLKHALFYEDALVMKSLKSDRISLANHKNEHGLHFDFNHFPFFGIWAAKDADFVCLEPWCGIADSANHDQNLETKEGIIELDANQDFERSWAVSLF